MTFGLDMSPSERPSAIVFVIVLDCKGGLHDFVDFLASVGVLVLGAEVRKKGREYGRMERRRRDRVVAFLCIVLLSDCVCETHRSFDHLNML